MIIKRDLIKFNRFIEYKINQKYNIFNKSVKIGKNIKWRFYGD